MSTDKSTELAQVKKAAEATLANDVVERHSMFQLQCFVLGKEPTIQGKLQQCLREIKSRKSSLEALELEIAEQEDNLVVLDIEVEETNDKYEKSDDPRKELKRDVGVRRLERKRRATLAHLGDLRKKEKDISEELMFFLSAFDQLNRREKLRPWDDPEVQKQYWSEKLRSEVNTRLLLRQLPDVELMRSILCLHDDAPIKVQCLHMLRANPNQQQAQALQQNQGQEG